MVKRASKRLPDGLQMFTKGDPRTIELGRKGGQRSTLAKKLAHRKKCTPSCPIYDKCPVKYWVGEDKQCALNTKVPARIRDKIVAGAKGGRTGVLEVLEKMALEFMIDLEAIRPKISKDMPASERAKKEKEYYNMRRKLFYDLMNYMKTAYGEKQEIELQATITPADIIDQINKALKQQKKEDKHDEDI